MTDQFPWLVEGARLVSVGLHPLSLTDVQVTSVDGVFAHTEPLVATTARQDLGPNKFWAGPTPNERVPGGATSTGGGWWVLLPADHPKVAEFRTALAQERETRRLADIRDGTLVTRASWQWLYEDVDSQSDKQVHTVADARALIAAAQQYIEANPDAE